MELVEEWQEKRFEADCGYCKGLMNPNIICDQCWERMKMMNNLDGIKETHIVLKKEDLIGALESETNEDLRKSFKIILYIVSLYRQALGKKPDNNYIVINTDESYAAEVIEILKRNGHWG